MKKASIVLKLLLVVVCCFIILIPSLASSEELFKLRWKKKVGRNWLENNPLIFGKYILHASELGAYLFDQKGTLLWSFKGKGMMRGVVASPHFIVVSDTKGYVYALSWDGEKIWEFKAKDYVFFTSMGDIDGDGNLEVIVGSYDNYIYALSGRNGKLLWKFKTGWDVDSSPALGDLDGNGYLDVVVGSKDHYIYTLSGKEGKLLWKFKTGNWVNSSPALGDLDGNGYLDVVVGSFDSYIYAISGKDGRLLWKFKTGGIISPSPALGDLDGDGYLDVVVGSEDYHIYALSGRDGRLLWKFKTEHWVVSSPALGDLDRDGNLDVVVGSGDDHIYALSGKTGKLLWKFKTNGDVNSSPALGDLDGDGYLDLAVASFDGYLYIFEATMKGGKVVWSRFHGDACGTGLYENAVSFAKFNLSKEALAWRPPKYSLQELAKLKGFQYFSLKKVNYKPSSNPKINEIKRKKAITTAVKMARLELKQSLKEKIRSIVKSMVKKYSQEAELKDPQIIKAIYRKVLHELFKKIDNLEPYRIKEPKKGEIQVLVVADEVINMKKIEEKVIELVVKAME